MSSLSPALQLYLIPDMPSADDILPYLRRIDATRRYTNFGPLVLEFENKLRTHLRHADRLQKAEEISLVTVCNGHQALEIGMRVMGIGAGHHVLVPAITFPSCPLAIQHVGAEPVLGDVDSNSWTLTPQIARMIVAKTPINAVMPVAVYGLPLPTEEWDTFSSDTGIPVLIDAAAALEAQQIPRHGLVMHSMHATKPFGIGEGAVLVSRDTALIEQIRRHENFGTQMRIAYDDGSNGKMNEYSAAVGLAQLARWEDNKRKRRKVLALYREQLAPLSAHLSLQVGLETTVASLLMLRLKAPIANKLCAWFEGKGLAVHRTYMPPLYRHPHFATLSVAGSDGTVGPIDGEKRTAAVMQNCESLTRSVIGIPFHPFLIESDIAVVCALLRDGIDANGT